MTHPRKELSVACGYLLRLMKAQVELSPEQINVFKRTFHDILSKRFSGHWFPATPHRGSAYRCLQTKHWKDPVLKSIAERSRIPLHRYLPIIFTMWIDPGEVAVCFGDEGTWCSLHKHDIDDELHQTNSDAEETPSSVVSDHDALPNSTQNLKSSCTENQHTSANLLTTSTTDGHVLSSVADDNHASNAILNANSTTMNTQMHSVIAYNYSQPILNDWNVQSHNR